VFTITIYTLDSAYQKAPPRHIIIIPLRVSVLSTNFGTVNLNL